MLQATGIASQQDVYAMEAKGFPQDLPENTYEMIRRGVAINPRAPALSFFLRVEDHRHPETWTYAQLFSRITQTANFFDSLGATKNDVIAYVLPNLPETHFVLWGGEATGIVMAINPLLEPTAIADLLNAAGASILVTLAPFPGTDLWAKVQQALPKLRTLKHVVLVNLTDRVQGIKHVAAAVIQKQEEFRLNGWKGVRKAAPKHLKFHDFWRGIKKQPRAYLRSRRTILPDDPSSYFCTGGTTGTPKIAVRCHRNEVSNAWSASQFLGGGIGTGKNIFCGLPLFHVNGVLVTGLLPFSKGAHVILGTPQGYRGEGVVKHFWDIVEKHRINFFSGVPTLYSSLLQIPIANHRVDSLEYGLCGAAPLPVEVFRDFQQKTGIKILEGYGLTEGTCVSSVNPPLGERRLGSIGLRIPGQAMKAVLLDENGKYSRDCNINEVGVLIISGPNVFNGYKFSDQNKGLWVDTGDPLRWLNTGDLGRQDQEGYFWLTGRKKELIIRGGHNIDPAMIEEPLHRHPAVQLAAAVGMPDPHAGELPVAYVQLKPGSRTSEQALFEFAQREITERAALPKHIRIVDQIPLTAVGKIFKPALKHQEIKNALVSHLQLTGVLAEAIDIHDDKVQGTVIAITVRSPEDQTKATRVLGHFPFHFRLQCRPEFASHT